MYPWSVLLGDRQTDRLGGDTISTARRQVRAVGGVRRVTSVPYQVTSVDNYHEQCLICILVGADRPPPSTPACRPQARPEGVLRDTNPLKGWAKRPPLHGLLD
jgi:hypothetical protein